jgi:hypothetical protein
LAGLSAAPSCAAPSAGCCAGSDAFHEKIPRREAGDFFVAGGVVQRNSRIRMMRGIGIPISQSKMGMGFSFQVEDE